MMLGARTPCSVASWRGGAGGAREVQEGGDIHILRADSHFCTAETQHCKATIFQLKKILKGKK